MKAQTFYEKIAEALDCESEDVSRIMRAMGKVLQEMVVGDSVKTPMGLFEKRTTKGRTTKLSVLRGNNREQTVEVRTTPPKERLFYKPSKRGRKNLEES